MPEYFREMFEAMRDTAIALTDSSQAIHRAGQAITRMAEAGLRAQEEHEDLRETVHRLEGLVEELLRRQAGGPP